MHVRKHHTHSIVKLRTDCWTSAGALLIEGVVSVKLTFVYSMCSIIHLNYRLVVDVYEQTNVCMRSKRMWDDCSYTKCSNSCMHVV